MNVDVLSDDIFKQQSIGPNKLDKLLKTLSEQYKKLGTGCYRTTFQIDKKWVLKVPKLIYPQHISCNLIEYIAFNSCSHLDLAKCELFFIKELPVIIMERVVKLGISMSSVHLYDGYRQFGSRFGKPTDLICYDYGNEDHLFPDLNKNVIKSIKNRPQLPSNISKYMKENPICRKRLW